MQPLATPSGKNWHADETILVAGVLFDKDVSGLFPYLNAELDRAVYLRHPPFIRFRYEKTVCALHPFYLAAFPFADRRQAEALVGRLFDFLNGVHARRATIRPSHKTYNPVSVVQILKLLPKTNCGRCGFTTCMAFAGAVRMARAIPQQCPDLVTPLSQKAVFPIYDDHGNVVERIDLDFDAALAGKVLVRQKETIAELRQRLSSYERLHAKPIPDYDPPFGVELSAREMEILRLMAHGATNMEISQLLSISHHTVKSHVIHIFNKLGVNDRTQAAVWAACRGLI